MTGSVLVVAEFRYYEDFGTESVDIQWNIVGKFTRSCVC